MKRTHDSGWIALAIGLGSAGTGLTGLVLVAIGAAEFEALPVALLLLPLLLAVTIPAARAVAGTPQALIAIGAAWVTISQIDQHLSEAILVGGVAPEIVHHGVGLVPLAIGATMHHWWAPAPAES